MPTCTNSWEAQTQMNKSLIKRCGATCLKFIFEMFINIFSNSELGIVHLLIYSQGYLLKREILVKNGNCSEKRLIA